MRRAMVVCASIAVSMLAFVGSAVANEPSPATRGFQGLNTTPGVLSLAGYNMQDTGQKPMNGAHEMEDDWDINGPIFLRSATPESPGEVLIKNNFSWEHEKNDSHNGWFWGNNDNNDNADHYEYELEVEWGVVENHELIFAMPWRIGDGRVEGNGDLTVGWHWRLWKEDGMMPAVAIRNFLRFPTGVGSSSIDYELRGLITKTLVPGATRLHINPYAKSVNGNNNEDVHPFQYGAAIGIDHRINDSLLFVADYKYSSEEDKAAPRGNHEAEFDLDWDFAQNQILGVSLLVGLDGDDYGADFGAKVSYMISFGG